MSAILDPDELLTRVAHLVKRVIDYRIFGIALLDEDTQTLEMKVAISYGDDPRAMAPVKLGEGLVGYAALHKEVVLVPDVTKDPRYIKAVSDVRSELVVPLLLKDRCIGVFDLESPELDAFNKKHVELLTLLASQAAVAIENARLYESIRDNERGSRRKCASRSACRWRCCRRSCRSGCAAWTWRGTSTRARAGRRHLRLPRRRSPTRWWWRSATCRARACRRRSTARRSARWCAAARSGAGSRRAQHAGGAARRHEPHPARAQPRGVLLHAVLRDVRVQEADRDVRELGPAVPGPKCANGKAVQLEMPGVPLGSFGGSTYDDFQFPLEAGDVFVFCSDGIFEAFDEAGEEFGARRVLDASSSRTNTLRRRRSSTRSSARCRSSAAMRRRSTTDGRRREDQSVEAGKEPFLRYRLRVWLPIRLEPT